jgi:PPOX class probable FMN-dependent enzyme
MKINPAAEEEGMALEFSEIVTSEAQFRAIIGSPNHRVLKKQIAALDEHCRAFIAKCPFLLISSCDAKGNMDVSPKGDPPGFVLVLDDHTLAIPDRPGNRRTDTFLNLLQNPHVGMLFLVPGKQETLRASGNAFVVRDLWLRERMALGGKLPEFAIIVRVQEVFFHCAKCVIRSKLWESKYWPETTGLPTLAQAMVDQGNLKESVEEMHALIEKDAQDRLY